MQISALEDLQEANKAQNPVNIAGYGREGTHKGYLTWILDSNRWCRAGEALVALCHVAGAGETGGICGLHTLWEQKLGPHRKVDLLSRFSGGRLAVPIELKTDAGPTGEDQLEQLSQGKLGDVAISCRLVLLLGSSAVQDFEHGDFLPLRPENIVRALAVFEACAPQFVRDWLQAVSMEAARYDLALDVYRLWKNDHGKRDEYWGRLGYRSKDHLMFYALDHIRKALRDRDQQGCWRIYSGGYNTVLNLKKEGESWVKLRDLNGAQAFFEFNDDRFVLKVEKCKGANQELLKKWFGEVRRHAKEIREPGLEPEEPKGNRFTATWLSLLSWGLDLSDPKAVAAQVDEILRLFGPRGLLREYVAREA